MSAIFRNNGSIIAVKPTVDIAAGDIIKVADTIVAIATRPVAANTLGYLNTSGEYDVDIPGGKDYFVGDKLAVTGKTLDGKAAVCRLGTVICRVSTTDKIARVRLIADKKAVTDKSGGTAGTALVAAAGSTYTKDELAANFATIAAALNS